MERKSVERLKEEADALAAGGMILLSWPRREKLFNSNACGACHSMEGTRVVGPALNGIYGKERVFADGGNKADYGYIKLFLTREQKLSIIQRLCQSLL